MAAPGDVTSLRLQRLFQTDLACHGLLSVGGAPFCFILEDPVRPTKLAGKTAIPAGVYSIVLSLSPRFGRVLPLLLAVPGFTGVRIHTGNTADDTEGCLLPGLTLGLNSVGQSKQAFERLLARLGPGGSIEIKDIEHD